VAGNLFVSGPGDLWIISSEGELLRKIIGPERPANMAWGEDGKTLFLTAYSGLYKIRVFKLYSSENVFFCYFSIKNKSIAGLCTDFLRKTIKKNQISYKHFQRVTSLKKIDK